GQFVEMVLASSQPPLSATEIRVLNFANEVEVEVDDSDGQEVDDTDDNGNPVDDVEVDVTQTVSVHGGPAGKRVKKVLHLHHTSSGSVIVSGLATGHAKISVSRTANGVTSVGRGRVGVKPNTRRLVRVRLHHNK